MPVKEVSGRVLAGRDILAALAARGIGVQFGTDGQPTAGPVPLLDEADRALLATHRESVLAALSADPDEYGASSIPAPSAPGTTENGQEAEDGSGAASSSSAAAGATAATRCGLVGHSAPIEGRETGDLQPGNQVVDVEPIRIDGAAELQRTLPELLAAESVGLDLETTGLDPRHSRIRLVQLASGGRTWVIDAGRVDVRALAPLLNEARRLVGHNLKFDLRHLGAAGLRMPCDIGRRVFDTMLAAHLLGAGDRSLRYGLGEVAQRFLGVELDKSEQASDWSGELRPEQVRYAARDAAVLLPLASDLGRRLVAAGLERVAEIEHRALPAVGWLESAGVLVDGERWLKQAEAAEARKQELERELNRLAPSATPMLPLEGLEEGPGRWDSPEQVRLLLGDRGVALPDTREATLREHLYSDPLVPLLLEHREASKQAGAFGRDFLAHVDPGTSRVHADYLQLGSEAGRMACRSPNLQQIPRDPAYRACFRAPTGRALVMCDFVAIEMRIAAEVAGDERLIEAFKAGEDVHVTTARSVMGRADVTKADRQAAKSANFGLLYGMGASRLRSYARAAYGVELSEEQAHEYRERFFEIYSGLRRWHQHQPDHPVATRTLTGRRRLNVERFTEKLNTPIQGTGADGLKLALALLFERRGELPKAHPVLAVHDEIVVECEESDIANARQWLESAMREGMGSLLRRVPVEVEVAAGRDWSMAEPMAS